MPDSMKEVGIVISATDKNARKVLSAIGKTGQASLGAVRKSAAVATDALGKIGMAGALFNQGLELAKKGFELFRMAILDTIAVSKEFRSANDPAIRQLNSFAESTKILRARLGDALIPVLQGLVQGIKPVIQQFTAWVVKNRELIGTQLLEWLDKIGNILISVVAKGTFLVSRAWSGWLEIINVVRLAINRFFEFFIKGNAELLSGVEVIARTFDEDLANSIGGVITKANEFSNIFGEMADENVAEVQKIVTAQSNFESQLDSIESTARRVLQSGIVAGYEAVKNATIGAETETKKLADTYDIIALRADAASAVRVKKIQAEADLFELAARKQDEAQQRQMEISRQNAAEMQTIAKQVGMSMANDMGSAFAMLATGAEGAGQAMKMSVVNAAQTAVMSYAASGAAAGAFSQAGIPIVGPILATAAAAMLFGLIKGFMSSIPAAATGGLVTSGIPGVDMNPVMTQKGEGVFKPGQTKAIMRLADSAEKNRGSSGGNVTINYTRRSTVPERSAQTNKEVRELGRVVNRMKRRKMW